MYTEARRINPYYWNNHISLGNAHLKNGEHEKAIAAYQDAAKLNPDRGNYSLGTAYLLSDQWEKVIPTLEKASLDPSLKYNLGVAQFYLGQYQEAARTFEAVVAKDPDDVNAMLSLADTYRWSGRRDLASTVYGRARAAALKAQKANPKSAEPLSILAVCSAQSGQPAEALSYIRQARGIDKNAPDYMFREALVHSLAQRWPEALASLSEALQNGYSVRMAENDPELKELRSKPEFQNMIQALPKKTKY
jgi:tetratricopeptide (TPR) repeat protein